MRKSAVISSIAAFLGILLIFFWFTREQPEGREPISNQLRSPTRETNTARDPKPLQESYDFGAPEPPEVAKLPPEGKQRLWATLEMGKRFNVPISFYGKVVDQDMQLISGAKVKVKISTFDKNIIYDLKRKDENKYTLLDLLTDGQGSFSIENQTGRLLEIESLSKEGYQGNSSRQRYFRYSPEYSQNLLHNPERENPVVFQMWKKGESVPLVRGEKFYGIIPDGRTYTIDLVKNQKKEGVASEGDLLVQIKRPSTIPHGSYDWSCVIEAFNGGLVEVKDSFGYRAPESGYAPRVELVMNASNPKWSRELQKNFYLKSRNGKIYSSFSVEVISDYSENAVFSIKSLANPTGSRNLEYDPAKEIKPGK